MKKMSKKLESLLVKMGFERVNNNNHYEVNRYEKKYGNIASISVYEIFDKELDKEDQHKTYWDVNFENNTWATDEIISSIELKGRTIKEHKQSMIDLFNDLEIIGELVKE